jgi:predicted 3-demethylubiquinone-9 3-methyltransferase (glyoxalase superfamily)
MYMNTITPHLWFDKEAKEAAELYTSLFPDSKVTSAATLHDTPSGDSDIVSFELAGQPFMAISAGPVFKFTPAVSFHVKCQAAQEVDLLWGKLSEGGQVLMPLGKYPFSEKYGWCTDRFGLSWQVVLAQQTITQKITPVMMFTGDVCGKAEEAMKFYTSVFNGSVAMTARYGAGEEPNKEGSLKYGHFTLDGLEFGAMDSAQEHGFTFNEAISFIVPCDTQEEIDGYWAKLSAVPESEQCGWLKDKYGVSWQITPTILGKLLSSGDEARRARVTQAFLKMKKFDIAALEKAAQ